MATQDDEPSGPPATLSVKLHMDVVKSARIIVAERGGTLTDLLSNMLRPQLFDIEREVLAERSRKLGRKSK
jgi:hypothetical protein